MAEEQKIDYDAFKGATPGLWHPDLHGHVMAHGGSTNVASTWTTPDANYPAGRPYKANAALIAAAPTLLADNLRKEKEIARLRQQLVTDQAEIDRLKRQKATLIEALALLRDNTGPASMARNKFGQQILTKVSNAIAQATKEDQPCSPSK